MKRVIQFHKAYIPAVVLSLVVIVSGLIGYAMNHGFNLGVDFQAGLMQEVQIAPTALEFTYSGKGTASIQVDSSKIDIVLSGPDVQNGTHSFPFATYATLGALRDAMIKVPSLGVNTTADLAVPTSALIQSAHEDPKLGSVPYALHYLIAGAETISLEKLRAAVSSAGSVSVQVLGAAADNKFMIRVEDQGKETGFAKLATDRLGKALTSAFGADKLVINRTDYVGARFSKGLTEQAAFLVVVTLLVILVYCTIRFKPRYAVGAVMSVVHDALVMVAFIAWSRMEFNTTSIAAILTILGYSINDTIVNFDRIREDVRLYPDDSYLMVVNRAVSETLGRTIITTLTTLLAVLSLFFFTTGSMKDFALVLIVGMASGVYSTIFIASAFVVLWDGRGSRKAKKALKPAAESK